MAGVYAGGDIVTGAATVILAMGTGRQAARSMKVYLGIRDSETVYQQTQESGEARIFGIEPTERTRVRVRVA
jgi:glutamate synthase (NADPH/NADH) small chain